MTPHYEDAGLRLFHGSNKDILPTFPDASFDSIVTDPPYELGFMGKGWDSTGIAYDVELWAECLRVLKPGGHLLAFGGTRTWHRVAAAIEDAGFEIRDSIAWMYGSGFPKSMDVARAVERHLSKAPENALVDELRFTAWMRSTGVSAVSLNEATGTQMGSHYLTAKSQPHIPTSRHLDAMRAILPPVPDWVEQIVAAREEEKLAARERNAGKGFLETLGDAGARIGISSDADDRARDWDGWGTALKPAFEPIVVARKPLVGTVAANTLAYGTGAVNIDACRIGVTGGHRDLGHDSPAPESKAAYGNGLNGRSSAPVEGLGRFPANVLLDTVQAEALDRQSGILTSGLMKARTERAARPGGRVFGSDKRNVVAGDTYADSGGASRFFAQFTLTADDAEWQRRLDQPPSFRYVAKAPSSERPEVDGTVHATVKPLELMRWLVRLVTRRGGHVLDLYAGSGTTGEAALLEGMECTLIELEADHLPLILQRVRKPLQPSMFGDWEAGVA